MKKKMIKIGHAREVDDLEHLPQEVINAVQNIAAALDHHYGKNRDIDEDMGGYILIITEEEALYELRKNSLNLWESIPEYVDRIPIQGEKEGEEQGEDWSNTLILCNNDFGISILMPMRITPKHLIEEIE